MNRSIQILTVLFLAQGGVVAWSSLRSDSLATFTASEPFLSLDPGAVSALTFTNAEGKGLTLANKDGKWIVPELKDFPADAKKITTSLKKVADLKRSFPVARTEIAQKQLKVADDSFEEKIEIATNDGKKEIFIGSSPSFRNAHVRQKGESDIYSFQLASYDFPVDSAGWVNSEELFVPQESLKQIEVNSVVLSKKDQAFVVSDLASDEHIIAEERDSLVAQLTKMRFLKVLTGSEADGAESVVKITYTPLHGAAYSLELLKKEKASAPEAAKSDSESTEPAESAKTFDYFVKSSRLPHLMSVGQGIVDKLLGITRGSLVEKQLPPAGVEALDAAASGVGVTGDGLAQSTEVIETEGDKQEAGSSDTTSIEPTPSSIDSGSIESGGIN
jgi:hypothetical protein